VRALTDQTSRRRGPTCSATTATASRPNSTTTNSTLALIGSWADQGAPELPLRLNRALKSS